VISFAFAANCTSFNYSDWNSCSSGTQTRTVTNSTPVDCTGGSPVLTQNCTITTATTTTTSTTTTLNASNIEKGFSCLVQQTKPDCTGAVNVQDAALTILASPNNTKNCITQLKTFKRGDCFGTGTACNIKETAWAILALNHVGEKTDNYASWLKNQTKTATDLIWQLQQNSEGKTNCKINYDSQDYPFIVQENKKIDVSAGNCLTLTQSNYWFQISPNCYDKEFTLTCDKESSAALMYKNPSSQTLYLLSDTKTAGVSQPVSIKIKSTCFGAGACDYETSLLATLALDKIGSDISAYTPYLIAAEDANQQYLPDAFLQIMIDFGEYGTKLIKQNRVPYWEAEGTTNGKYYDTSLALIALQDSNQPQVKSARDWLLNQAQNSGDGCWNNKDITDTAMALWALEHRAANIGTTTITTCEQTGYTCRILATCGISDRLTSDNYYCAGTGKICCKVAEQKTCADMGGRVCDSTKQCSGAEQTSSDSSACCLASCDNKPVVSECESEGGYCRTSCSTSQEPVSFDCGTSSSKCCKAIATPTPSGSLTWLWILLIILIVLVIIAIVFKERIKLWFEKRKTTGSSQASVGPRGGFPPAGFSNQRPLQQRPMAPGANPQTQRPMQARPAFKPSSSSDDDVFKKLKDIGK
jgi:hypothetical protein